jgi:serine/threonine-protein kinase PknG
MTACTQAESTGTIVDGYCDVCGSPATAVPFVPAQVAASAASPASAEPDQMAVHRESGFPAEPKTRAL